MAIKPHNDGTATFHEIFRGEGRVFTSTIMGCSLKGSHVSPCCSVDSPADTEICYSFDFTFNLASVFLKYLQPFFIKCACNVQNFIF